MHDTCQIQRDTFEDTYLEPYLRGRLDTPKPPRYVSRMSTALLLPAHCVDLWIGPCRTYPVKTTLVHRRVNVNCKCECVQYIVLLVPSSTEVVRTADGTTDPTQGFPICFRLSCDVRLRSWVLPMFAIGLSHMRGK